VTLGTTHLPVHWVANIFGLKRPGAWCWPPTPFSAEVRKSLGLYIYSLSEPVRKVDNLTSFLCRCLEIWEP